MYYDASKYDKLAQTFNLCDVPKTPDEIETINNALGTMVMVNYPNLTADGSQGLDGAG